MFHLRRKQGGAVFSPSREKREGLGNQADLLRLPLNAVSTRELAGDALALAVALKITAYDATYVALSQRLSLPLLTANESLVRRLAGSSLDARWLGEWPQFATVGETDSSTTHAPR